MDGGEMTPAGGPRPLRVLFSMRNFWYVRIFEPVIRELATRGHSVHIAAERGEGKAVAADWNAAAAALAAEHAGVSFEWVPRDPADAWAPLRTSVHLALDYLRFLGPEYADAPVLGARARDRAPAFVVKLAGLPLVRSSWGRRVLTGVLRGIERAVPFDPRLAEYVRAQRPDVVLLTPLLTLGSEQHDVLRVARRMGVPSVLCVGSWDHLSSKALLRELPDRVLVWNEIQKREAVTLHRMPPEIVTVTGAQCFDQWFDRRPALDREAFCRKVGLDASRPYVLYVCSALFEGSPSEARFVRRWAEAVRGSGDSRLAEAGILVRPHPKRGFEWDDVALHEVPSAVLWPAVAAAPFQASARDDYFDSMYHAAAVVGLNTSALIEAGIVGRSVHTLLLPEFQQNQEGTLHFHYLLDGGLLRVARDLESNLEQLARAVQDADPSVHHNRAFVEQFVRPSGIRAAATPVFIGAVERVAAAPVEPQLAPVWAGFVRALALPLRWTVGGPQADKVARARRWHKKALAKDTERAAVLAERQARKEAAVREREARLEASRRATQASRQQKLDARRRAEAERQADKRRRRHRHRVVEYYRRLIRPFSAHR